MRYVDQAAKYVREGGRFASFLDNPNSHRLIELFLHTFPIYRHLSNVSELLLESVHHIFKKWLENNVNHNFHITAVEVALATDWGRLLYASMSYWKYVIDK